MLLIGCTVLYALQHGRILLVIYYRVVARLRIQATKREQALEVWDVQACTASTQEVYDPRPAVTRMLLEIL